MTGGTSETSKCSSLSAASSGFDVSAGLALSLDLSGVGEGGSSCFGLFLSLRAAAGLSGVDDGDCSCCAATNGIVKIAKSKTATSFMRVSEEKNWESMIARSEERR